jgi:hypothetical protein
LVEPQNKGGEGFLGLGLKIDNCNLMIWVSKSLRQILGLNLKTKWAMVCWLRLKTDWGGGGNDVRHASRSSGLLLVKASRDMVF